MKRPMLSLRERISIAQSLFSRSDFQEQRQTFENIKMKRFIEGNKLIEGIFIISA